MELPPPVAPDFFSFVPLRATWRRETFIRLVLLTFILSCFSSLTVTLLSVAIQCPPQVQTKRAIAARWMPTYKAFQLCYMLWSIPVVYELSVRCPWGWWIRFHGARAARLRTWTWTKHREKTTIDNVLTVILDLGPLPRVRWVIMRRRWMSTVWWYALIRGWNLAVCIFF